MLVRRPVPKRPTIRVDRELADAHGGVLVAGVDEAGRGPLAGPVVAAAVMLPFDGRRPAGLNDSKKLTAFERGRLYIRIQRCALAWGVGIATAQEIDLLNILEATRLAARRALAALDPAPGALVTDALALPGETRPVLPLIKADAISASVAAASILAKVTRDRLMEAYAEEFPEYNWHTNRGYPTSDHYEAIGRHGPTILHRMTFNGVGFFDANPRRSPSFHRLERSLALGLPADRVRAELETARHRLPPPDYAELARRVHAGSTATGDSPPTPCASSSVSMSS